MEVNRDILNGSICPYCGNKTKYLHDSAVYAKSFGYMIYACIPCDAYVSCHKPNPTQSKGRLANKELRQAKIYAHYYFDDLWNKKIKKGFTKSKARKLAYKWLSKQMNISFDLCHIGFFDIAECMQVVEICKPYKK